MRTCHWTIFEALICEGSNILDRSPLRIAKECANRWDVILEGDSVEAIIARTCILVSVLTANVLDGGVVYLGPEAIV
jgi:hypothetical protein